MKPWVTLATCALPGGEEMTLCVRDGDHAIRVNGRELMSSRRHHSEEQLAVVACAHVREKRGARVLIGGLGLGYTLKACLREVARDAEVVVAELLPDVVAWNRDPAFGLAHEALRDPRVRIVEGDVFDLLSRSAHRFDAIMLDADNRTTAMNTAGNDALYFTHGLSLVLAALKQDGCVVYWSAGADPALEKAMRKSGFRVTSERALATATGGGTHTLIIGRC